MRFDMIDFEPLLHCRGEIRHLASSASVETNTLTGAHTNAAPGSETVMADFTKKRGVSVGSRQIGFGQVFPTLG